jgi:hypothetical protein
MRYIILGLAFLSMGVGLLLITKIIFGIILIVFSIMVISIMVISIGITEYTKHKKILSTHYLLKRNKERK